MTRKKSREIIISEATDWYRMKRTSYEQFANKINIIITDILKEENVLVHEVCSRAKEIDSFIEKIKDEKYDDPINQITDLTGIRVITYVESDLKKVCDIVGANFTIDPDNSSDKGELLGIDKVGYKSIHYICKLSDERTKLTDYKKFENIKFEIQIRTILQHTWAEVEHDRNYKFTGVLPKHLQRRFKILAGVLELADRELNDIALEIDHYSVTVVKETKEGKLDTLIDSTSLKAYLNNKFKDLIPMYLEPNFNNDVTEKEALDELRLFKIETLADLDYIIPNDYISNVKSLGLTNEDARDNFISLLRTIMMISDSKRYFDHSWRNSWTELTALNNKILLLYGIPIEENAKRYDFTIGEL